MSDDLGSYMELKSPGVAHLMSGWGEESFQEIMVVQEKRVWPQASRNGLRSFQRCPLSCTHDPLTHVVRNWLPPAHEEEGTRDEELPPRLPARWAPLLESRASGWLLAPAGLAF